MKKTNIFPVVDFKLQNEDVTQILLMPLCLQVAEDELSDQRHFLLMLSKGFPPPPPHSTLSEMSSPARLWAPVFG